MQSDSDKGGRKANEQLPQYSDQMSGAAGRHIIHEKHLGTINRSPGTILALQGTIGNSAVRQLLHQQRWSDRVPQSDIRQNAARHPLVHNLVNSRNCSYVQRGELTELVGEVEEATRSGMLAAIQANAMFALLPALEGLPVDVRTDEMLGASVGGSRLVTAMRVVKAKGTDWLAFAASNNGELAALPNDQIGDIMDYLGAPKDARYFKSDRFDGRFDGAVDPAQGVLTLFFRVKFDAPGTPFGGHMPGTPEWFEKAEAGIKAFAEDFKREVENTWSGKAIRPACPIGAVKQLTIKVAVNSVDSGEHKLIYLHPNNPHPDARSKMGEVGNFELDANKAETYKTPICNPKIDPTCTNPDLREEVETTQVASSHEFGHALGLHHPHCKGGDDVCYGTTEEELNSIMGKGSELKVLNVKVGQQVKIHDDFMPFEQIAQEWGKEVFPGALSKCNKWSGG